jgi:uncharacterized membrane protein
MSFSPMLPLHISAGIIGILSGAAAMSFRKGSPRHVLSGRIFVIAMLTLSASAVWLALLIPSLVGIGLWILGLQVVYGHVRPANGVPLGMYLFMGSVMLLAAAGDIRMLARGGVFGAKRIVRHLWRMCFGLFIATGSFFLGQQQVFPAFIRKTNVLFVPAILPLILLIFWLFRVRFTNAYKGKSMPRSGDVPTLENPAT